MGYYEFNKSIDGIEVVSVYSAAKITEELRKGDAFKEMLRKTGFPEAKMSEENPFGYNWSLDTGGSIPPSNGGMGVIVGPDHAFNFRKESILEKGYMALTGIYAGKSVPGIIMLVANGMNCGLYDAISEIDEFFLESKLEQTEMPERIIKGLRKDPRLEMRLEELRKFQSRN